MNKSTHPGKMKWLPGDVLLEEYRILELLGKGGMGQVYLVETVTPPILKYAVKILVDRLLNRSDMKRLFLRELQTWIDLSNHPNIISCRFCKTIQGHLAIFSEYAEAGSLKQWVRRGNIATLEQILDVAIQTAWGLAAAHNQGVIHLDIKPDNILMTRDHIAKITDFGLSVFLQPSHHRDETSDLSATGAKQTGGMTPAYASPEQAVKKTVTLQSDMWSWGVTVMELFAGRVTWQYGFMAESILEDLYSGELAGNGVTMPAPIYEILRKCFAEKTRDRWKSMTDIAGGLQQFWSLEFGRPYPRQRPVSLGSGDSSRSDIPGSETVASWTPGDSWIALASMTAGLSQPQVLQRNPSLPMTLRGYALMDIEKYDQAVKIFQKAPAEEQMAIELSLARLYADKARIHECIADYPGAIELCHEAIARFDELDTQSDNPGVKHNRVFTVSNLGNLYYLVGKFTDSITYHQEALRLAGSMTDKDSDADWINTLARVTQNLAITHFGLKQLDRSTELSFRAIEHREYLVFDRHRLEYIEDLILSYTKTAMMLGVADDSQRSLELYNKAISLIERSSVQTATIRYARHISAICLGKASVLRKMTHYPEAVEMFDSAIQILTNLTERLEFLVDITQLAIAYLNKGNLLRDQGDFQTAERSYSQGIEIIKTLISDRGHQEYRGFLAKGYMNQVRLFIMSRQLQRVGEPLLSAFNIYVSMIQEKNQVEYIREFNTSLKTITSQLKELQETMDYELPNMISGEISGASSVGALVVDAEMRQQFDLFEQNAMCAGIPGMLADFQALRQRFLGSK